MTTINEKLLSHFFRQVRKKYTKQLGNQVLGGFYQGMKLPKENKFANLSYAQIIGTYELFLQKTLHQHVTEFEKFVDIGCGCGYYTNGIALKYKMPTTGIDSNKEEIAYAYEISEINRVPYAHHINGYASHLDFKPKALHLIDIEGAEWQLLHDASQNKTLYADSGFIIELHKTENKGIDDLKKYIKTIFTQHKIEFITESPISIPDQVYNTAKRLNISRRFAFMLTNEMRDYYQEWAVILPK